MNNIFEKIWEKKIVFFGMFFLVFTLSYILLVAIDFLPEAPKVTDEKNEANSEKVVENYTPDEMEEITEDSEDPVLDTQIESDTSSSLEINEIINISSEESIFPVSIFIEKLDKTITVLNPTSRAISDLDDALLSGVVRHPDSAALNQEGNVFILGHSSYLPRVFNKNFQAFNGIQNLEWGDLIEVYTDEGMYMYRVEKVYRAKAQDVTVPIAGSGYKLTLATCNSFGSMDDRYIVEANRIN
jgi:LPXTG-site transpeptidase (sortase) family protein